MKKRKRIVDHALLNKIKELQCIICGHRPCDPCHIKSKGSGGDDVGHNVIPMCRKHHTEQHQIGIKTFIERHKSLKNYLIKIGWDLNGRPTYRGK